MSDPRVVIVGMGEVGRRLAAALDAAGNSCVAVTRHAGWEEIARDTSSIVLVCVREEDLGGALDRLRGCDPSRVVLVQNGWIRPLLGEWPGCTRGLIWFTSKGDFFRALRPSPFSGPAAGVLVGALARGGLTAEAVPEGDFRALEAEKMGFNCVVGLPLAVHGLSLSEYMATRREEAEELFRESAGTCAEVLGIPASTAWWGTFCDVVAPIGWVRAHTAKALEYRSGAVLRLAASLGRDVPTTRRLLGAAGFGS
jgi:hypothetical protein